MHALYIVHKLVCSLLDSREEMLTVFSRSQYPMSHLFVITLMNFSTPTIILTWRDSKLSLHTLDVVLLLSSTVAILDNFSCYWKVLASWAKMMVWLQSYHASHSIGEYFIGVIRIFSSLDKKNTELSHMWWYHRLVIFYLVGAQHYLTDGLWHHILHAHNTCILCIQCPTHMSGHQHSWWNLVLPETCSMYCVTQYIPPWPQQIGRFGSLILSCGGQSLALQEQMELFTRLPCEMCHVHTSLFGGYGLCSTNHLDKG